MTPTTSASDAGCPPDNWRELCAHVRDINARFVAALGEGQPEPPDATTLAEVVLPSHTADGLRAPRLRFGDPRVMALLASIAACAHGFDGITNAALRQRMSGLWQPTYSSAQATYDLGRLCRNGLPAREQRGNCHQLTEHGRRIAGLLPRVVARIVLPVLTQRQHAARPPRGSPAALVAASRAYDHELGNLLRHERVGA